MNRIVGVVIGVAILGVGGLPVAGEHIGTAPKLWAASDRPSQAAPRGLRTVALKLRKMDCAACTYIIRRTLEDIDGVASAKVSYGEERAVVTYDPSRCGVAQLLAATASLGFPSTVIE